MMSRRVWPAAVVVLAACGAPAVSAPTPGSDASTSPEPDATSDAGPPDLLGPSTEAWDVIEEAPFARLEMAVTALDGRIGADGTVRTLPQLNEPHHGHGAAVVDGVAYVLLGGPEPTLSAGSTVEMLDVDP